MVVICDVCGCSFTQPSSLKRHLKNIHVENEGIDTFSCDVCQKRFRSRRYFLKHWRSDHLSTVKSIEIKQRCPLCKVQLKDATSHFVHVHNLKIEVNEHTFKDEKLFYKWKKQIEENTNSKFNLRRTKKKRTIRTYICHRSGMFYSESKGIRNLKTQGSKKINGFCPASMKFMQCDKTGLIRVKFTQTHVGHNCEDDLCHLNISPTKKDEVAKKLINKVPKRAILKSIRESCDVNVNREIILLSEIKAQSDNYSPNDLKMNLNRLYKKVKCNEGGRLFLRKLLKDAEKKVDLFLRSEFTDATRTLDKL